MSEASEAFWGIGHGKGLARDVAGMECQKDPEPEPKLYAA